VPIGLDEANAFILSHHRHHGAVQGAKFALAAALIGGEIVAVATVGRPVSRMLDDGWTAEITRLATDGTEHAASFLYGACYRVTTAMGYRRLITYILDSELGTSLKASGYRLFGPAGGGSWNRTERPRIDTHPTQGKLRWGKP
jgi:hypothetical protein